MTALLGIPDSKITNGHEKELYYDTNKTGGSANYFLGVDIACPECLLCRRKLHLIVQLYCPLESSTYHRTLYVFACSNPPCWNKSESWIVYRCQSDAVVHSKQQGKLVTASPSMYTDDWGANDDDWGSDTEDSGTSNTYVNALGDRLPASNKEGMGDSVHEESSIDHEGVSEGENDNQGDAADMADHLSLDSMCIDDTEDEGEDSSGHIKAEDMLTLSEQEKGEMLSKLTQYEQKPDRRTSMLQSYFINVFDESEVVLHTDSHVKSLLKEYERKEGQSVICVSMETGKSGGGNSEKYDTKSSNSIEKHVKQI